jgi:hypothetical protein
MTEQREITLLNGDRIRFNPYADRFESFLQGMWRVIHTDSAREYAKQVQATVNQNQSLMNAMHSLYERPYIITPE